jgi:hypothetical protein
MVQCGNQTRILALYVEAEGTAQEIGAEGLVLG